MIIYEKLPILLWKLINCSNKLSNEEEYPQPSHLKSLIVQPYHLWFHLYLKWQ